MFRHRCCYYYHDNYYYVFDGFVFFLYSNALKSCCYGFGWRSGLHVFRLSHFNICGDYKRHFLPISLAHTCVRLSSKSCQFFSIFLNFPALIEQVVSLFWKIPHYFSARKFCVGLPLYECVRVLFYLDSPYLVLYCSVILIKCVWVGLCVRVCECDMRLTSHKLAQVITFILWADARCTLFLGICCQWLFWYAFFLSCHISNDADDDDGGVAGADIGGSIFSILPIAASESRTFQLNDWPIISIFIEWKIATGTRM